MLPFCLLEDKEKRNMEKEVYLIWLSMIPKLGKNPIKAIRESYPNLEMIWKEKNAEKLKKIPGIGEKIANEILNPKWKKEAWKEWEKVKKHKIQVIGFGEDNYPPLLKEIYDPPICLYAFGDLEILKEPSVAIVGSRMASDYAKQVAYYLAYQLAQKKIHVVSGMAKGVDSYSHKGAIRAYDKKEKEKMGKTIAVIGTGLGEVYPKENEKLRDEILASGGVILSEYPMETKANRYHFPERNRIISGLTRRNHCGRSW